MNAINKITEGGQLSMHSVRMLKQVAKITCLMTLTLWIFLFIFCMSRVSPFLFENAWYYFKANFLEDFKVYEIQIDRVFWNKISGQMIRDGDLLSTSYAIYYIKPHVDDLLILVKHFAQQTGWIACGIFGLTLAFFFIRGKISTKKLHIAGNQISPAWKVILRLKLTRNASPIKIGKIPLIKGTETQHVLVTGGTGSGKTNCFHHLLPQIQSEGQRAIIIDTTGSFIERYYREGIDKILNPFDKRTVPWHPWIECQNRFDYEAIAESFIPQSYSDDENYWNTAARALFSSVLIKLESNPRTSELNRWILFESLARLATFVQGTRATAHIDLNSERTAGSVRSITSSFLGCLEFLSDTTNPFSIREWVHSDNEQGWLFLACDPIQRAALNPLLSAWFSIAMRSLLQLPSDLSRRLWFIIDELPTLNRLKDLESFLSESRKYGGCALLAIQSPAQLEATYGTQVTRTILGNCATKIIFSEQDPEIASRISRVFGEREIKEYQRGLSYGANDIRDGVNLTLQTRKQPLISPTAIQFLKKNEAYIRLPGNWPITQIKLSIAKP